jgi:apolipoprotein N-acyltransferase
MAVFLAVLRHSRGVGFLVFPAAGTAFDWLRSLGFLGYPWGMLGASQYALTPMIQIASVTGVWGVTFVMMLCNAVLAWYAGGALSRVRRGPSAAIALAAGPDFVVSSETAFVPIIRRWSEEDPAKYPYAALVRDFLAYQKKTGRWRVTGNDDYRFVMHDGSPAPGERLDFSGSVLFSPRGQRGETYHKIHLVPSTEYFPFKKQLPAVYRLLKSFDAYLWEPGDRRVVFRHTAFACSSRQGRRRPASRA